MTSVGGSGGDDDNYDLGDGDDDGCWFILRC